MRSRQPARQSIARPWRCCDERSKKEAAASALEWHSLVAESPPIRGGASHSGGYGNERRDKCRVWRSTRASERAVRHNKGIREGEKKGSRSDPIPGPRQTGRRRRRRHLSGAGLGQSRSSLSGNPRVVDGRQSTHNSSVVVCLASFPFSLSLLLTFRSRSPEFHSFCSVCRLEYVQTHERTHARTDGRTASTGILPFHTTT